MRSKILKSRLLFYITFFTILLFFTIYFNVSAQTNQVNQTDQVNYQCQYYKELFSIISKNGSASEINKARDLMNKYCLSMRLKNNIFSLYGDCPFVIKPANCPTQRLVPIMKNGCIARYYCQPEKVTVSCPPVNWDINCPENFKYYTKDARGCYVASCKSKSDAQSSLLQPIKNLTPISPMPSKSNISQSEKDRLCDNYTTKYLNYLTRLGAQNKITIIFKKLSEYYCGGPLKIQK